MPARVIDSPIKNVCNVSAQYEGGTRLQRGSINFTAKWFKLEILVEAGETSSDESLKNSETCGCMAARVYVCAQLSTNQLTMHAADIAVSAEGRNRECIRMHGCTRNGTADRRTRLRQIDRLPFLSVTRM